MIIIQICQIVHEVVMKRVKKMQKKKDQNQNELVICLGFLKESQTILVVKIVVVVVVVVATVKNIHIQRNIINNIKKKNITMVRKSQHQHQIHLMVLIVLLLL